MESGRKRLVTVRMMSQLQCLVPYSRRDLPRNPWYGESLQTHQTYEMTCESQL